ncbi:hypothetical protein [Streptococcus pluranimalium]|uniref:hypothetical protein n=1 Tax=Streptococcus pluranimalium TaxID=82348 RepID=UPI002A77A89A|nr:hypothetical protein [Streptococcus pluranimalium]
MITEEMKTTTEMILMTYLMDMVTWLIGQKNINQDMARLDKEEMLTVLKNDYDDFKANQVTEYDEALLTTISTLERFSEQQFQELKMTILSWEPNVK